MSVPYYVLFKGELWDVPGRMETWTEQVRYLGDNRWELSSKGTDFSGTRDGEASNQIMESTALVSWAIAQDDEDEYSGEEKEEVEVVEEADEEQEDRRAFGPRASQLLKFATLERDEKCVACLNSWLSGSSINESMPTVLDVNGVIMKGIWLRIRGVFFEVVTTIGPGYLYPPDKNQKSKFYLKTDSFVTPGRIVSVPDEQMMKIKELQPALEALLKKERAERLR